MNFQSAANFCLELRRFPPRRGIDATRALLSELDDPHEGLSAVQIAGSNGKGSTARMLESILREAGLSVGLYTSPHLDDVRERIRVDGRKIPKAEIVDFVEQARAYITGRAADGDAPTFFETLTVMALWHFDRADVDVAILEVGIGGRYDATSVVDPVASAVTSVTLEHTDILGDTIEEIATDKAHVAPADTPLVTGATGGAREAIREVAGEITTVDKTDADVEFAYDGIQGSDGRVGLTGQDFQVETRLPLPGSHQARNAGVAAALARQVADVDDETLARGLRNAHWPGRFEVMSQDPLTVLDGAHNPGGCEQVAETLGEFEYGDLHLVVGAMVDKDHHGIATALPEPDHVVACQADVDRAEDEAVVAAAFEGAYPDADVETRSDVAGALEIALDAAEAGDAVLVSGSLYTVREARTRWTRAMIPKQIGDLDDSRDVLSGAHVTDAGVWRMRGKGVHRAVKTRVQPRQAQYLKEELLSLGGECAVSALNNQDEEPLDVVMLGTLAQFKRLAGKLDGQPYGLSPFADEIRDHLGIQVDSPGRGYPWEDGTAIMGILNITPDSFHDGGEYNAVEAAVARAGELVEHGADILDIGGESTRPGAEPVPVEDEIDRVVPVIERLDDLDVHLSIDTRKAAVAEAALEAGADILNDVSGLEDPEMRHLAAEHDAPVVVMHSLETPVDPETTVHYDDVVEDVLDQLTERVLLAEKAGLDRSQILVDPGIGFGKSPAEDFEMLGRIEEFEALGCPVLVGHSHKSLFGHVGLDADERTEATVAGTALAAERGADVIRVHDVKANVAARDVVAAADDADAFGAE